MYSFKSFFLIYITFSLVKTVFPAEAIQPPLDPPAKYAGLPGCYSPQEDIMLPVDEPYRPVNGKCVQYTCGSDGYTEIFTCGAMFVPNCTLTEDLMKPYPECCPTADQCKNPSR